MIPKYQIRAVYDHETIRVYQAYNAEIASKAVAAQTFVSPPFKMERMTWIKPSFLWMMYRSGWAKKDKGQTRVLAIDIKRSGLEWAFENAILSHRPDGMSDEDWAARKLSHPVRIQWDPERDLQLNPLQHRSIQIGLTGEAVKRYVENWIVSIEDVTSKVFALHKLVENGEIEKVTAQLPNEKVLEFEGIPRPENE